MNETSGSKPLDKRKIVWIFNIVVAIISLLSILCYFFGPVWQIKLSYTLTADQLLEMTGDALNFDAKEVIGEDGEKLDLAISLSAGHVLGAFTSAEETVDKMLDDNINSIVDELSASLNGIAKKTVKVVAKNTVKSEVKNNVKKYLTQDSGAMSDEEVESKLGELGITDDYISEKTDKLIDDVFAGGSDVDSVTQNIMDTVDEVYSDLQKNAQGKEEYRELADSELTEEDKAAIEDTVRETLGKLAQEDGTIDPDEMIAELLAQALGAAGSGSGGAEEASAADAVLLADEADGGESASGKDKLVSALRDTLNKYISDPVRSYAVYVFYGMAGLMIFSMLPWVYVLIKLIVKLVKKDPNPTVKLAVPIWLGWLFFLILVAIPSVALMILKLPSVTAALTSGLGSAMAYFEQLNFTITSVSWTTVICAIIAFGISIYYMVVRRQLKREANAPMMYNGNGGSGETAYYGTDGMAPEDGDINDEIALGDEQ